jgi:hypothetical protein
MLGPLRKIYGLYMIKNGDLGLVNMTSEQICYWSEKGYIFE